MFYFALALVVICGSFYVVKVVNDSILVAYEFSSSHFDMFFKEELQAIGTNEYKVSNEKAKELILLSLDRNYEKEVILTLFNLIFIFIVFLSFCLLVIIIMDYRITKLKKIIKENTE